MIHEKASKVDIACLYVALPRTARGALCPMWRSFTRGKARRLWHANVTGADILCADCECSPNSRIWITRTAKASIISTSRARSSVGQSVRLITGRSQVRTLSGPPFRMIKTPTTSGCWGLLLLPSVEHPRGSGARAGLLFIYVGSRENRAVCPFRMPVR